VAAMKFHKTKPVGKPRTSWDDVVWTDDVLFNTRMEEEARAQKGL